MLWNRLELLVTTICNRTCPHCCYRIPKHETLEPKHYEWSVFERAAEALGDLELLYVSGGEATLHPEFPRIAREFRALFRVKQMVLVTNGAKMLEHKDSLHYFDNIWVTKFPDDPKSIEAANWVAANDPVRAFVVHPLHIPLSVPGGGGICFRHGLMACAEDRVWPCCVGPGLAKAQSVELKPGCRELLDGLTVPCETCAFSQP